VTGALHRRPVSAHSTVAVDTVRRFGSAAPDVTAEFYGHYGRLVFAAAHRVLGDRALAEEATLLTFVRAWEAAGTFEPGHEIGPWLAGLLRQVAVDLHRREHGAGVPADLDRMFEVWPVRQALDLLTPDEREVVRLVHREGLDSVAIAGRLGLAEADVVAHAERAHHHLAATLGYLDDGPEP
jgi:RNA polymerase sigma-70 factor (ECF subfamily)